MKKVVCIILIIILAFVLRIYKITEIPPSLNWDEVSIGYNAYSILKTGKDEWNQFLPLHFKSYGEYKLPVQIYASIPGIAIFGLNDFGVRITPVLYGTLTILLLFFLARSLFKNNSVGLISAFLLAVSPWHIQLTRASFESSFSVFWVLMGLWFLVKGFEKSKWILISIIPFAIAVYTYNSARVFVPLFLFATLIIYRKTLLKYKKIVFGSLVLFILFVIPLVPYLLNNGTSRFKLVSITDEAGLTPRINENRNNSKLPQPLPVLINNKVTYISFYFIKNYLSHFTPQFLFISGAPHKQHHVQGMGELYYFQAPLILFGLYSLYKKKKPFKGMLLSWLLIAFIPVSVTNDSIPNALRTIIANPFYQIMTAFGLYESYIIFNKKSLVFTSMFVAASIIGIMQFISYLNNFYNVYPKLYSRDWQYGYKQVMNFIQDHYNDYDEIVITDYYGQPYIFTLFYLQYSPLKFQNDQNLNRLQTKDFISVLKFDKFYFPNLEEKNTGFNDIISQNMDKRILFIGRSKGFPDNIPSLLSVNFLNGKRAFEIVEHK